MVCKKYSITNTSNDLITFSYQRCDDYMWMYQTELSPGKTKTIWSVGDSFEIADTFLNKVTVSFLGDFPSTTLTPTPSVTKSLTPTPIATATMTPTQTTTQTGTPNFVSYAYSGITENGCEAYPETNAPTIYSNRSTWAAITVGDILAYDRFLINRVPSGWYADNEWNYYVDQNGLVDTWNRCF